MARDRACAAFGLADRGIQTIISAVRGSRRPTDRRQRVAASTSHVALGRSHGDQRRDVRQLLRVRLHRAGRGLAPTHPRLHRHADRNAQRHLQLPEHRDGAGRRRDRRSVRRRAGDARLRGHSGNRSARDRAVAAVPGHGSRPPDFRARSGIHDRRDHGCHRSMVRGAPAGIRVRPESELRPARIVPAPTCRQRGSSPCTTAGGSRRCGLQQASRRRASPAPLSTTCSIAARERDSPSPRRRRPTGSSGAICGASTAPTGTSWASASRSIR